MASMSMTKVSPAKYHQMAKRFESIQKKAKKVREVADEKIQHLVRSSEVAVAGFGLGVLRGSKGKTELAGVPTEIVAAGALHLSALFGVGGDLSTHLHSFGDGALAVAAMDLGEIVGKKGPGGLKEMFAPNPSSAKGIMGGQRLTDAELEALTR